MHSDCHHWIVQSACVGFTCVFNHGWLTFTVHEPRRHAFVFSPRLLSVVRGSDLFGRNGCLLVVLCWHVAIAYWWLGIALSLSAAIFCAIAIFNNRCTWVISACFAISAALSTPNSSSLIYRQISVLHHVLWRMLELTSRLVSIVRLNIYADCSNH